MKLELTQDDTATHELLTQIIADLGLTGPGVVHDVAIRDDARAVTTSMWAMIVAITDAGSSLEDAFSRVQRALDKAVVDLRDEARESLAE